MENSSLSQAPFAPDYDRTKITTGIVHFGLGNFHRAHQAMYLDRLMRQGLAFDWGICGVGVMASDSKMRTVMQEQNGLYSLLLKHPDGTTEPRVIGSVHDYLFAPEQTEEVLDRLSNPNTRIVSLTVTEGGYNIDDATGKYLTSSPGAVHDAAQPDRPQTTFGYIVEALRRRRAAGIAPFTVMSCDNLPGNGHIARNAVISQATMSDPELAEWIAGQVSFPNGMVDRITPATTVEDIQRVADKYQVRDAWPVTCEPFAQWVLEDNFPMGRPPFELVGAQMVDDVVPYELMKLRLLNAAHQSLAHWGRLLGLQYAHEAAVDPDIVAFTRAYLHTEARPTLRPVPGIDLDEYVDTLFARFANPAIADTLARLAQDASDRMPKFVIPTARERVDQGAAAPLSAAMTAAWALGMEGVGEGPDPIVVDDSQWDRLHALVASQAAGDHTALIRDPLMFGGLGEQVGFVEPFEASLDNLRKAGARAVMRDLVGVVPGRKGPRCA